MKTTIEDLLRDFLRRGVVGDDDEDGRRPRRPLPPPRPMAQDATRVDPSAALRRRERGLERQDRAVDRNFTRARRAGEAQASAEQRAEEDRAARAKRERERRQRMEAGMAQDATRVAPRGVQPPPPPPQATISARPEPAPIPPPPPALGEIRPSMITPEPPPMVDPDRGIDQSPLMSAVRDQQRAAEDVAAQNALVQDEYEALSPMRRGAAALGRGIMGGVTFGHPELLTRATQNAHWSADPGKLDAYEALEKKPWEKGVRLGGTLLGGYGTFRGLGAGIGLQNAGVLAATRAVAPNVAARATAALQAPGMAGRAARTLSGAAEGVALDYGLAEEGNEAMEVGLGTGLGAVAGAIQRAPRAAARAIPGLDPVAQAIATMARNRNAAPPAPNLPPAVDPFSGVAREAEIPTAPRPAPVQPEPEVLGAARPEWDYGLRDLGRDIRQSFRDAWNPPPRPAPRSPLRTMPEEGLTINPLPRPGPVGPEPVLPATGAGGDAVDARLRSEDSFLSDRGAFLGEPKITSDRNASDLRPRLGKTARAAEPEPFMDGAFTIRRGEPDLIGQTGAGWRQYVVMDGDTPIASYDGDTLVVDPKYRRMGIATALVADLRMRHPEVPPAPTRTRGAQAVQERAWERIQDELRRTGGAGGDNARVMFDPEGRSGRITPSAREPGRVQATVANDDLGLAPRGHSTFDNDADAREWLRSEGYTIGSRPMQLEDLPSHQQVRFNLLADELSTLEDARANGDDWLPEWEARRRQVLEEMRSITGKGIAGAGDSVDARLRQPYTPPATPKEDRTRRKAAVTFLTQEGAFPANKTRVHSAMLGRAVPLRELPTQELEAFTDRVRAQMAKGREAPGSAYWPDDEPIPEGTFTTGVDGLVGLALRGIAGRLWYGNSTEEFTEFLVKAGVPREMVPDVIRITSPFSMNSSPLNETKDALAQLPRMMAGMPIGGGPFMGQKKAANAVKAGTDAQVSDEVLEGGERLKGEVETPKVWSYTEDKLGNERHVTADLHAGRALGIPGGNPRNGLEYAQARAMYRRAAERLKEITGEDWTPAQTQAAAWVATRMEVEKRAREIAKREGLGKVGKPLMDRAARELGVEWDASGREAAEMLTTRRAEWEQGARPAGWVEHPASVNDTIGQMLEELQKNFPEVYGAPGEPRLDTRMLDPNTGVHGGALPEAPLPGRETAGMETRIRNAPAEVQEAYAKERQKVLAKQVKDFYKTVLQKIGVSPRGLSTSKDPLTGSGGALRSGATGMAGEAGYEPSVRVILPATTVDGQPLPDSVRGLVAAFVGLVGERRSVPMFTFRFNPLDRLKQAEEVRGPHPELQGRQHGVEIVTTAHLKADAAESINDHLARFLRADESLPEEALGVARSIPAEVRQAIADAGGLRFTRDRDILTFVTEGEEVAPVEFWNVLYDGLSTWRAADGTPFFGGLADDASMYYIRGDGRTLTAGGADGWEEAFERAFVSLPPSARNALRRAGEPRALARGYGDRARAGYDAVDADFDQRSIDPDTGTRLYSNPVDPAAIHRALATPEGRAAARTLLAAAGGAAADAVMGEDDSVLEGALIGALTGALGPAAARAARRIGQRGAAGTQTPPAGTTGADPALTPSGAGSPVTGDPDAPAQQPPTEPPAPKRERLSSYSNALADDEAGSPYLNAPGEENGPRLLNPSNSLRLDPSGDAWWRYEEERLLEQGVTKRRVTDEEVREFAKEVDLPEIVKSRATSMDTAQLLALGNAIQGARRQLADLDEQLARTPPGKERDALEEQAGLTFAALINMDKKLTAAASEQGRGLRILAQVAAQQDGPEFGVRMARRVLGMDDLPSEVEDKIRQIYNNGRPRNDPTAKAATEEGKRVLTKEAQYDLAKYLQSLQKSTIGEIIFGTRRWSLLTAPATHVLNTASGAVHSVSEGFVVKPLAAGWDRWIARRAQDERRVTFSATIAAARWEGAKEGARKVFGKNEYIRAATAAASAGESKLRQIQAGGKAALEHFMSGIDPDNPLASLNQRRINYGNSFPAWASPAAKLLQIGHDTVYAVMSLPDQIFFTSALKGSLQERAELRAMREGLKRKSPEWEARIKELTDPMTAKSEDTGQAFQDALYETFKGRSAASDVVSRAKKVMPRTMDFAAPFTLTPINLFLTNLDYTPVIGAIRNEKLLSKQRAAGTIDDATRDKKRLEAWARSFGAGSALMLWGMALRKEGRLELPYSKREDQEERNIRAQEDVMDGSIKVGDKWFRIGMLGPQSMVVLGGGAMYDAWAENPTENPVTRTARGLGGMLFTTVDQISDLPVMQTVGDVKEVAGGSMDRAGMWAGRTAASFTPFGSGIAAIGRATDPVRDRKPSTVGEAMLDRFPTIHTPWGNTPGRESVPEKVTGLGDVAPNPGATRSLLDPMRTREDRVGKGDRVIDLLHEYRVDASPIDRSAGETGQEAAERQKRVGKEIRRKIETITADQPPPAPAPPRGDSKVGWARWRQRQKEWKRDLKMWEDWQDAEQVAWQVTELLKTPDYAKYTEQDIPRLLREGWTEDEVDLLHYKGWPREEIAWTHRRKVLNRAITEEKTQASTAADAAERRAADKAEKMRAQRARAIRDRTRLENERGL